MKKSLNMYGQERWMNIVFFFILYLGFALTPTAGAADLKDIVSSLYGGDGVDLLQGGHEGHFTVSSIDEINSLNAAIIDGAQRFPVSSTGGGFTYIYVPGEDLPLRTTNTLGPIFSERSHTLGKRKVYLGFSYTIINFDRFEGKSTSSIRLIGSHQEEEDGEVSFENDLVVTDIDLSVRAQIYSFYATYGLTNHIDMAVFIPLITLDIEADAFSSLQDLGGGSLHQFGPPGDNPISSSDGSASGIGDILARFKYHFLDKEAGHLAVNLDVKIPTGDEDNLLGSGSTMLKPTLIASKTFGKLTPHLNIGYELDIDDGDNNTLVYAAGFDSGSSTTTLAVDVIGRERMGFSGVGDSIVDGSIGIKYSPEANLLFIANVQFPLNADKGLRASFTPTFGFEYSR